MNRHATSPLLLLACTIHVPAIAGAVPGAGATLAAVRTARNGSGSPRARRYSPDRRPPSSEVCRVAAYCSNRNAVRGPSLVTAVEVMRRSPLKNDPCSTGPAAAISKGNGTSTPFTTTTPSHRPASDAGWPLAGLVVSAASPVRKSAAADRRIAIALLIRTPWPLSENFTGK